MLRHTIAGALAALLAATVLALRQRRRARP